MKRIVNQKNMRGTVLIEGMIALSLLLIGMLGIIQMQAIGLSANKSARSRTRATELARDLCTALEGVPFNSPLLDLKGTSGSVNGSAIGDDRTPSTSATLHTWTDLDDVANSAIVEEQIERADDGKAPQFQRRWTVWQMDAGVTGGTKVKLIAVSVIYLEPSIGYYQEVIQYTQVHDNSMFASGLVL